MPEDTPTPAAPDHPGVAAAVASVVNLGKDVDGLRKSIGSINRVLSNRVDSVALRVEAVEETTRQLVGKVDGLAETVAGLAEQLAELTREDEEDDTLKRQSWLTGVRDPALAEALLAHLVDWLGAVYLRYPGAAHSLSTCWMWHPSVVEELLVLWRSWVEAYTGKKASVMRQADWHDRLRPHVAERLGKDRCSIDRHAPGPAAPVPDVKSARPRVPLVDAAPAVLAWWAGDRDAQGPIPSPDLIAQAETLR